MFSLFVIYSFFWSSLSLSFVWSSFLACLGLFCVFSFFYLFIRSFFLCLSLLAVVEPWVGFMWGYLGSIYGLQWVFDGGTGLKYFIFYTNLVLCRYFFCLICFSRPVVYMQPLFSFFALKFLMYSSCWSCSWRGSNDLSSWLLVNAQGWDQYWNWRDKVDWTQSWGCGYCCCPMLIPSRLCSPSIWLHPWICLLSHVWYKDWGAIWPLAIAYVQPMCPIYCWMVWFLFWISLCHCSMFIRGILLIWFCGLLPLILDMPMALGQIGLFRSRFERINGSSHGFIKLISLSVSYHDHLLCCDKGGPFHLWSCLQPVFFNFSSLLQLVVLFYFSVLVINIINTLLLYFSLDLQFGLWLLHFILSHRFIFLAFNSVSSLILLVWSIKGGRVLLDRCVFGRRMFNWLVRSLDFNAGRSFILIIPSQFSLKYGFNPMVVGQIGYSGLLLFPKTAYGLGFQLSATDFKCGSFWDFSFWISSLLLLLPIFLFRGIYILVIENWLFCCCRTDHLKDMLLQSFNHDFRSTALGQIDLLEVQLHILIVGLSSLLLLDFVWDWVLNEVNIGWSPDKNR